MAARGATQMVIVVTGGDSVERAHLPVVDAATIVIAADSGIDHAHALGLVVDLAIGDFDSVTPAGLARAEAQGASIERHLAAKDATDLELALDAAMGLQPSRIHLLGGHGGRLDHLLGNLLLLAAPRYASAGITAQMGAARVTVIRRIAELSGRAGDLVTLLAVHGPAHGITTTGLRYPLDGDDLQAGSSRGVSNVLVGEQATVSVSRGVIVAVQPGPAGSPTEERPS